MTGKEFRAIRMGNHITQDDVAIRVFRGISTIRRIEKTDYVPQKYIQALSDILKVDLLNENKLEMIKKDIPGFYYEKNKKPLSLFN